MLCVVVITLQVRSLLYEVYRKKGGLTILWKNRLTYGLNKYHTKRMEDNMMKKLIAMLLAMVICLALAAVSYTHLTLPTNREV